MSADQIHEKMQKICKEKGYKTSANSAKIANAKMRMFGVDEWHRCPCDGMNADRFCISDLCQKDIEKEGVCHCNCYHKEEKV